MQRFQDRSVEHVVHERAHRGAARGQPDGVRAQAVLHKHQFVARIGVRRAQEFAVVGFGAEDGGFHAEALPILRITRGASRIVINQGDNQDDERSKQGRKAYAARDGCGALASPAPCPPARIEDGQEGEDERARARARARTRTRTIWGGVKGRRRRRWRARLGRPLWSSACLPTARFGFRAGF